MFNIDQKLQILIFLYLLILFYIYQKKPLLMFTDTGKIKPFGSGKDKTILPLWLVPITLCLLVYIHFVVKENDYI